MATAPWLAPSNFIPPAELTKDELLDTWMVNRNNVYGVVLAEEMMRRLYQARQAFENPEGTS